MFKGLITFLKSRFFLINIILAIFTVIALVFLTLFLLKIYTRHGEALEVPNVVGMYANEADVLTERAGLRLVVIDSVFVRDSKPGGIVEQTPKRG